MDGPRKCHIELSKQKEKNQILYDKDDLQSRNRDKDVENKHGYMGGMG